ncbi:MAG TPA: enoyl-ACP reductase FabV [Myxococcota bacterium]|jgi:enoyl-[acyl-carrier protein] reductase/trans-2-enoyl-CoA reductase (NAD+)|nr:enoyl-ACP reductase FabV [Myxococcota bacterium]
MIIEPRVRGFICLTAHPTGCAANVRAQIDHVVGRGKLARGPQRALVIGASTGYGLATRVAAAFGAGAATLGVFFERPSEEGKPASPGWYNAAALDGAARAAGLYARSLNGDAFTDEMKARAVERIRADMGGPVDLLVYSVAAPRRTHPRTGQVFKSVLKPLGARYTSKTLDTQKKVVKEVTIEPGNDDDVASTVGVMGGEDWEMWIDALEAAGVLAPGATTVAYSYVGPEMTWPIYKNGTIGRAKADLEAAAARLRARLGARGGRAFVSINKAVVTQASSAIPVVPLYISLLFRVMKDKGLHEGCIEQAYRLFGTLLYGPGDPALDEGGRLRVDDLEMRDDVQAAVRALWPQVTTENLDALSDFAGYQAEFMRLFGFSVPGVDYRADVDPDVRFPDPV